ncbi:MAG TPA: class I SAM-dependent methyltransferase [Solirubrobacteraceae bacterium]|nr:class I SAM-dependent methyltransferase [Solirubrobacteraceae bacterium]
MTTFPVPSPAELERAYLRYRPAEGRFPAGGDRLLALSRGTLARRLDRIAPPGPVLDVGAGDGSLLRALRARGREAVGLERASSADGVLDREIEEFDERPGEWAAVVFWHSLEHLPHPAAAVGRAVGLLAPGGVLIIAVPNLSSWQARCFRQRWFHLDLPRHLVHLPAAALEEGVRERGLAVDRLSYWRGGQILFGWLHGMAGMLPGHPDLYSAIRRTEAQERPIGGAPRLALLLCAAAMTPMAALMAIAEIAAHAGGTVYLEARRR